MDYFNEDERAAQKRFAAKRDALFAPVARALDAMGATPNIVSAAGVLACAAAGFVPSGLWIAAAALLVLYVLLDGVDGPLARMQGSGGPGGSVVDIVADQAGLPILGIAAVYQFGAEPGVQFAYAFLYCLFIAFAVFVNQLGVRPPKFLRVKYFYFGLYVVCLALAAPVWLDWFAGIFALYYFVMSMWFLKIIHGRLQDGA